MKSFKKWQIALIIFLVLLIPFGLGLYHLGMFKFFTPKFQNVERQVFENTKSYLHGVQQDLGKYYLEYQNADENGKQAIRATIQMRFAEVDTEKLQSRKLKEFLILARGY
jgi:hypothetical protein